MLTVPPPVPAKNVSEAPISQAHFTELEHIVDGFSLMTYDYNAFGLPGPNAPLAWVGNNLQTLKLAECAPVLEGPECHHAVMGSRGLRGHGKLQCDVSTLNS